MKVTLIFLFTITVLFRPFFAYSQVTPIARPDNVGRAVSGSLQGAMQARGFAANDPRFGNTLARITPGIAGVAGTAAAITAGTITAPAWASVALAVGIGAVVTYVVNLGLDALTHWLFRSDGKVDESGDAIAVPTSTAITTGGSYWKASYYVDKFYYVYGGDGEAVSRQGFYEYRLKYNQINGTNLSTSGSVTCSSSATSVDCSGGYVSAIWLPSGSPASCPAGAMYENGACSPYSFIAPSAVPTKTGVTPQTAIADIPAGDLNKQLNPAVIAAIANRAWQQAASQPGYDGLPYPQSNPVTAAEVQTWETQNPNYAPTIQDFVSPNPVSNSQPQPWSLPQNPNAVTTTPAVIPNANTINPAASNPLQNLGADPSIGAPTLEQTPTAQQIIQPLLDLFPTLKNYSPPMSVGSCPRPTLNLFGHTQIMEAHCEILENNRAIIHASMVLAFSLLALLIILSA